MIIQSVRVLPQDPGWQGRGIGSELVRIAQQRRTGGLALWTFLSNLPARWFYERHGFSPLAGRTGRPMRSGHRMCGTSGVATGRALGATARPARDAGWLIAEALLHPDGTRG
jgi:hypothetical protein